MWSEHCSYKIARAPEKFPTTDPQVLQGPGENAGVIDIGDGLAVVFKIESHNHPVVHRAVSGRRDRRRRDHSRHLHDGRPPDRAAEFAAFRLAGRCPATAVSLDGVVAGIAGYGNSIGIPTVGGEISFDPSYDGNPLVNAFCLGVCEGDRTSSRASPPASGTRSYYVGAKTGRDGIHGATMASAEFDDKSAEKRPAVQVGDPFMEKLLLEACLEVMQTDALVGIQDMGAAGLTCSTLEMASRGGTGVEIDVSLVPQRETGMTPYEIMLSESQERMLIVVQAGREAEVERDLRQVGPARVAHRRGDRRRSSCG